MKDDIQHIKEVAFKYFNGNITFEEADELFAYIEEDATHKSLFRKWENEWFATLENKNALHEEWDLLCRAKETSEHIQSLIPTKKSKTSYFMIAASIALLIVGGILSVMYFYGNSAKETFYTMEVPYGQKSKLTLADGTVVWINSGSTLSYSNLFGKKNRTVQLTGEAYFEVKKDKKEFIVQTKNYNIKVKGTKFNVSAYPDDSFSTTTLLEGKVELCCSRHKLQMIPGETLRLDVESNTFARIKTSAQYAKSWSENRIQYDNIRLAELLKKLSRQYNREITLTNTSIQHQSYSVSIHSKQSLDEVLKAIGKITPIKIKTENDTIKIM